MYQPLNIDKSTTGEKDDRSQSRFQEIPSCDTLTQEEFVACLERIKDAIKDTLANEEHINDPAELALDRLAVSLDWVLITAVFSMLLGVSYLRSSAFAVFGDAKTHELYLKLIEITHDTATNDILHSLLAQTSKSPLYTFSRRLVQTSILSSCFFTFLAILGKLSMGRNDLCLNMTARRKSRRQPFLRLSPFVSRGLMLILKPLPSIFILNQLLLGIAFVVARYLPL